MTFAEGDFEPSPPPQLLSKLTDEDLVVAVEAVEAVVAKQQPRPSGRAQFRLLAWTVADARGAAAPLDKAVAETVGKRLDRQAQKVRRALYLVEADYRERRLYSSECEYAAMDAAHRLEMETMRSEVYVGFHELEPAVEEDAAAAEAAALPATLAAALQTAEAPRPRHPSLPLPAIPPDIARSLGRTGVQCLWDYAIYSEWDVSADYHGPRARRSEEWHQLLPLAFKHLASQAAAIPELTADLEKSEKIVELLEQKSALLEEQVSFLESRVHELESTVDSGDSAGGVNTAA